MNKDFFYKKLREALDSSDIQQSEIASVLSVSKNTVTNWKKGLGEPSATEIYTISKLCNKQINWFFEEKNEETSQAVPIASNLEYESVDTIIKHLKEKDFILLETMKQLHEAQKIITEYQLRGKRE